MKRKAGLYLDGSGVLSLKCIRQKLDDPPPPSGRKRLVLCTNLLQVRVITNLLEKRIELYLSDNYSDEWRFDTLFRCFLNALFTKIYVGNSFAQYIIHESFGIVVPLVSNRFLKEHCFFFFSCLWL